MDNTDLNKVNQELNKVSQELEFYKKALELACDDIRKRDCSAFSYTNFKCGVFREAYETCIRNIEFENYYLKKAREEGC